MNSKNKFVYLDKLTKSINPIHHKLINEIFSTDSITVIYNSLLPSLPTDVLKNLYINIKNNLYLFNPEQIEKLKPVVTFYTNIKFPCNTQCNPVNNPNRLSLRDKEYGTKKDCLSKCDKKVSINDTTLLIDTFLSLEDKLQYLISINKKELISTIQEKDIYNTDNILMGESPLYKQFRPYVITAEESEYKKNQAEYKNVKYLYKMYWDQGPIMKGYMTHDVIYEKNYGYETITSIISSDYNHKGGDHLVFNHKETTHLRRLFIGTLNDSLVDVLSKLKQLKVLGISRSFSRDSLSKLTQLETLFLGDRRMNPKGFDQPLGDNLSNLTQLKELTLWSYQPLGDSLSKLTKLEKLNLGFYNLPLGDSLSKLTQLKELTLRGFFNKPLGNSLSNLTQIEKLDLGSYNHPLGDSLSNLTQLKKLMLDKFDKPLGDSLSNLTQLKKLRLSSYILPFISISKLTQLEELDIYASREPHLSKNDNIWFSNLKQLKVVRWYGTLRKQIYNGGPSFSFTRKNSVKKELRDVDFKSKKSSKRRSPRKSPKRRSPRKSSKRRSPRKSPKRRSPRKSPKRRSPRKSSKRRSPRKSSKRRSPRN